MWIMADQLRRDCVGASSSRGVHTPHLEAMAAAGIVFDRFYMTCPLCVPARASLLRDGIHTRAAQ
ncbi:MAG: sulfatase-like hydrolase/transferase [Candidatus Zipacnadales bacterium]